VFIISIQSTLFGQKIEFLSVKYYGIYSNHWAVALMSYAVVAAD
jgi:hypothetical protein